MKIAFAVVALVVIGCYDASGVEFDDTESDSDSEVLADSDSDTNPNRDPAGASDYNGRW